MTKLIKRLCLSSAVVALTAGAPVLANGYNQAPMLDAKVASGELLPVEDRMPAQPLQLEAPELGTYGGTWRSALLGTNDSGWIRRTAGYEPLVSYTFNWDGVVPNVAKSWEVSEDATQYTFYLREDHKWSDGSPFTAEDVVFAVNDVANAEGYIGDRVAPLLGAKATALGPYTVVIDLPSPDGLFLDYVASVDGVLLVNMQKSFCSQFHPKYNSNADADALRAGLTGWAEAMFNNCSVTSARNAERPTLAAWIQQVNYDGLNPLVTFERNPYFYKVDQEGNQLPYIDNLSMTQVEDINSIVLMATAGEIDMTNRHIDTAANKPVFFENQENGGYTLYDTIPTDMNTAIIMLNLNYADDGFRELFQNKDFRVALSHGINRQEIIDVVYLGQGEPFQAAPRPESPFYDEELAKQYTEWDPDLANKMLDEIGLTDRNDEGIRLLPDGRPISIRLDVASDIAAYLDILELVKLQWEEIGIALDVRRAERSFVWDQKTKNEHMAHVWKGDGGMGDTMLRPLYFVPTDPEASYASLWAMNWYAPNNPNRQDPPEAVAQQLDLYKRMSEAATEPERDELFRQLLEITKDEFYTIGVSLPPKSFGIASVKMGNVPQNQPMAWTYPTPAPMNTSLLFLRQ